MRAAVVVAAWSATLSVWLAVVFPPLIAVVFPLLILGVLADYQPPPPRTTFEGWWDANWQDFL